MSIRSLSTSTLTSQTRYSRMSAVAGAPPFACQYLVVAGGGSSGGDDGTGNGAPAGAGGVRSSVIGDNSGGGASAESVLSIEPGTYTVTVGAGAAAPGAAQGINGSDSVFGVITSLGGGGGGRNQLSGNSGGCGGGAGAPGGLPGSGTTGQGYAGGATDGGNGPGGGGGAGGVGQTSVAGIADGGIGVVSTIISSSDATTLSVGEVSGSDVYFSGGGAYSTGTPGLGGGGSGAGDGSAGVNTGGGGGGEGWPGGSGVVIFTLPSVATATFSAGVTYSTISQGLTKVYVVTATSTTSETVTIS